MNIRDITRLLKPIKNKIFLMIGRGILEAVNNSEGTQKIQVTGVDGETITDIERLQNYGFASHPKPSSTSEAVIVFINGNRDQGIALAVQDRALIPSLIEGEVCLFHLNGKGIIKLKDGTLEISGDGGTLEFAPLSSKIKKIVDEQINDIFNVHTHNYVNIAGPQVTGVPNSSMTDQAQSEYSSTEVKIS